MKNSELLKILTEGGCYFLRHGASHDIWYSPSTNRKFAMPRHGAKELPGPTALKILREAGLR